MNIRGNQKDHTRASILQSSHATGRNKYYGPFLALTFQVWKILAAALEYVRNRRIDTH